MIDISMPKDLRTRRRRIGYCAILAVGFAADPGVFRLATAENIEAHIPDLQPGTWHTLFFRRVVWTAGSAVARTIAGRAERFLADTGHHLGQHWYRAELDLFDQLIFAEAASLNARMWSHEELMAKLKRQADEEADKFCSGVY